MPILPFLLFITVVFAIYGSGHLYLYKVTHNLWFPPETIRKILIAALVFFWISPLLIGGAGKFGPQFLVGPLAQVGYTWMAFLFIFFVVHVFGVGINWILGRWEFGIPMKILWFVAMGTALVVVFYGRYEAANPVVKKIEIPMPTFEIGQKIRVVQVSDLHFGPTLGVSFAKKVVDQIREQNPDMVVCTGDFLDRGMQDQEEVIRIWKELDPALGKYAVMGNHEFFSGPDWAEDVLTRAGFVVLRNRYVQPVPGLVIAGVDDPAGRAFSRDTQGEIDMLRNVPRPSSVILLKHQPRIESRGLFDLQLSGHTHGGQIFPFNNLVRFPYRYLKGLYELPQGAYLYTSPGTGTWGPPIRFLVPPEITVIELVAPKTR